MTGPHNITFSWDGTIDTVADATYHNGVMENLIFNYNSHYDGVDIYIYSEDTPDTNWGVASRTQSSLLIGGTYNKNGASIPIVETPFVSHEMGHVFGLWHTFHGADPFAQTTDQNACPEDPDGSNGETCGDYISDTPADPNKLFNVDPNTCEWALSGGTYMPLTNNYMAYTFPGCMDSFTPIQVEKMKENLSTIGHLQ